MKYLKLFFIGLISLVSPGFLFWFMIVKNPNSIIYGHIDDIYFMGMYMGALGMLISVRVLLELTGYVIKLKNDKMEFTHVYCLDCKHFKGIDFDMGINCDRICINCKCNGCECRDPEDSMLIEDRPNYKESGNEGINLYLDDLRDPPERWRISRSAFDAMICLMSGKVDILSLDHDLGENKPTGYDLLQRMVEKNIWPNEGFVLHTANPVGRENMKQLIERYSPVPILEIKYSIEEWG